MPDGPVLAEEEEEEEEEVEAGVGFFFFRERSRRDSFITLLARASRLEKTAANLARRASCDVE